MTAIASRRRRRTLAALLSGLVGAMMLPAGLVLAANSLLRSTDGDSVDAEQVITVPSTPAALLAVVDANGFVASLQMIALAPGGVGGTIVSIPVGSSAIVASGQPSHRVGDTYLTSGLEGLVTDVEGLLNISFTASAAVTESELASLLTGERNVTVAFDRAVSTLGTTGITELFPVGEHTLSPAQVAQVLAANQAGAPESDRLPILKSLWVGVAGVGRNAVTSTDSTTLPADSSTTSLANSDSGTASTIPAPISVKNFLDQVLTGEVQVWQFAANAVVEGDKNPSGADMYELDNAEVIMVVASVAPSSVSSLLASINVQIDSTFADAAITREAVLRLAYLGVNIVLIREIIGTPLQETVVEYSDDPVGVEVAGYSSVFGPITPKQSSRRVEGIDARIVLGSDFKNFIAGQPSGSGLTTTTALPVDDTGFDS